MNKYYPHLYTPLKVRNMVIRNRMGMPRCMPTNVTGFCADSPLESFVDYCDMMARRGAAIITLTGPSWPSKNARPLELPEGFVFDLDNEDYAPAPGDLKGFDLTQINTRILYTRAVQAVHLHGVLALNSLMEIEPLGWDINDIPAEYLDEMCGDFARICKLYQSLGFDGGCFYMSYRNSLLARSMSPALNRRTDRYGGTTALSMAVFSAVRKACGDNFLIEAQVSGEEPRDGVVIPGPQMSQRTEPGKWGAGGGYDINGLIEYAKVVDEYVDIFQLRSMDPHVAHPLGLNSVKNQPDTLRFAEAMKKAGVNAVIAPVGGYQDPDLNEQIIAEGKADMIYMARAFICDSHYEEKVRTGRSEDITPCLRCNRCHAAPWIHDAGCAVNPELVLGISAPYLKAVDHTVIPRKVAVVGGGPVGMRTALVAAERGHRVTLFEKTGVLGGQLSHADHLWFKWPIRDYKDYLIAQLEKSPVEVRMNTAATPEGLKSEGYEAVLIAAGAVPVMPDISGVDKARVRSPLSVFGREAEIGKNVVVVGGSETGVEVALYLTHAGHKVHLLSRQRKLARDAQPVHYIETLSRTWEEDPNFSYEIKATTTEIGDGWVKYTDKDGVSHTAEADDVVVCGGVAPIQEDYLKYAELFEYGTYQLIGDCGKPGDVRTGTRSGFSAAMML